jgi:hypothetical protein
MEHGRIIKKIFESKPEGRRRMGRPRLRWFEDAEEDLPEVKMAAEGSAQRKMGVCNHRDQVSQRAVGPRSE